MQVHYNNIVVMFVYAFTRMVQPGVLVHHVWHLHLCSMKAAHFTQVLSPPQHLFLVLQAAPLSLVHLLSAHLFKAWLATQFLPALVVFPLLVPSLQAIPYYLALPVSPHPLVLQISLLSQVLLDTHPCHAPPSDRLFVPHPYSLVCQPAHLTLWHPTTPGPL